MFDPTPFSPAAPDRCPEAAARAAIDERLGDQIAELSAQIDAATYRLLVLIREFDERNAWSGGIDSHCKSCAHWLNWRTGLALGAAREKVRVARALGELPKISSSMERGQLSYSKVRALTRVATPDNEEELLLLAREGTAAHVETIVQLWRRVDRSKEAEQAEEKIRHESRRLSLHPDDDGMWVIRGRLTAEAGAYLEKALDAVAQEIYRETRCDERIDQATHDQRRADAMGRVAEAALVSRSSEKASPDAGATPRIRSRAGQVEVVVHVDADALANGSATGQAVLAQGLRVPAGTSRRLSCDCGIRTMTHDKAGRTLDAGRRTRSVPPALRRALEYRDRSCRFPGCTSRICDAHHIEHWADGGKTEIGNLVLLCPTHHRAVHEEGWQVRLERGQPTFSSPAGRRMLAAPRAPYVENGPSAIQERLLRRGVKIDGLTSMPSWDGRPVEWRAFDFG